MLAARGHPGRCSASSSRCAAVGRTSTGSSASSSSRPSCRSSRSSSAPRRSAPRSRTGRSSTCSPSRSARWLVALREDPRRGRGDRRCSSSRSTLVTGLLIGGGDPAAVKVTLAFAIACVGRRGGLRGGLRGAQLAHVAGAHPRASSTSCIWEGALGGLLEGTRFLSIRQATLGLVAGLGGGGERRRRSPVGVSAVVITIAIVGVAR